MNVFRRIQAAGKGLILFLPPDEIEPVMTELSSKGLFIITWAGGPGDIKYIEKLVASLTHE